MLVKDDAEDILTVIKDDIDFSDHLIGNITLIEGKINKLKNRQRGILCTFEVTT